MGFIQGLFGWYWDGILDVPVGWLDAWFHFDVETAWKVACWKVGFSGAILVFFYDVFLRIQGMLRRRRNREEYKTGIREGNPAYLAKDTEFTEKLDAVTRPEQTIAALKKAKKYKRLAGVYASLNRHKEAGKTFQKAGDLKSAAMEYAKGGHTLKAAKLLLKEGDFATAARFFDEKGKHLKAAKAFVKLNDMPSAAASYAKAGKYKEAVSTFKTYFDASRDDVKTQVLAAESCYTLLEDPQARKKVEQGELGALTHAVAERFEADQRGDLAAKLFRTTGDLARAGKAYLALGRLEEAAQCMREAGNAKEASEIGGRFLEGQGRWQEAAADYARAGNFRRAGDCYGKAMDSIKSAECYEKAGEYYGAGLALIHGDKWESAIRMLQQVKEDHPNFNESRALLGRCFYELDDYAHCAATLDNHLLGERVKTGNIEYFNMLALAYEQLGELDKSKEVLLKIRSVDVAFRDVGQRLSNIESRISMAGAAPAATAPAPERASEQATAVMNMVENQLGQRYKLERELGRGGMGVVYLARDAQLDRPVALKFLGALVDGNEDFKKRFVREAKAAAKVSHPNIISIYEISVQEGNSFIAMEYVEGANLHQHVRKKGKLAPREAVNIMIQACSALEAVHAQGIIHRDIKPDNILIAKGGLVKLMDFGLAKGEGTRLTGANVIMGTPCYMPPEQTRGEETDARSDIYAMGLVLHEILTGETVFADGDILKRQQTEMPRPPGATVEGIPQLLDQIVMKCIAKRPGERFANVKELIAYLRKVPK